MRELKKTSRHTTVAKVTPTRSYYAINRMLRLRFYVCVIALPTRPSQHELRSSTNIRRIRIEIESRHDVRFSVTIKDRGTQRDRVEILLYLYMLS